MAKEGKNGTLLGGQAVIEGVMMRGPGTVATAVRKEDGSILVRKERFVPLADRNRLWKLPILRGAVGLFEMMQLGINTLNWSAEVAMGPEADRKIVNGNGEGGGQSDLKLAGASTGNQAVGESSNGHGENGKQGDVKRGREMAAGKSGGNGTPPAPGTGGTPRIDAADGLSGSPEAKDKAVITNSGGSNGALSHVESSPKKKGASDVMRVGVTVVVALAFAIGLFFVTPLFLTSWLFSVTQDPLLFNLTAGLIRMGIFLGYLVAISQLKDVKRLFMYHGAEHKTVFAFEKEQTLDADRAARHTRFHPRCGTSFLLVVMVVAIAAFAVLDTLFIMGFGRITLPVRLVAHLALLPLVAGASYEVIRLAARHAETLAGRIAVAPGLWLQRITTSEPDRDQLEVAVVALRAALNREEPAPVTGSRVQEVLIM